MENLSSEELIRMVLSVFPSTPDDRYLGILVDIPRESEADNQNWKRRRKLAENWYDSLKNNYSKLNLQGIRLIAYPDVGSNNAELPEKMYIITDKLPLTADKLNNTGVETELNKIFEDIQLFLAPTEYSTTAPLKNASRKYGFRAATMPGFSIKMVPALRIDYNEVNQRVLLIKEKLDKAQYAEVEFLIDNKDEYKIFFDLRFSTAHASSGRFPEKGTAGNFPSGESYIVPYEGEGKEKSKTRGTLPVQIGNDVLLFTINENSAIRVEGYNLDRSSPTLRHERDLLKKEPAYGNMAELGFGILGDFGLEPIDEILLDEKLGFHIAFGRSDHFGGIIGPEDFTSAEQVVHLDRIYIPATQPRILVKSIVLGYANNREEIILKNGKYLIF